MTIKIVHCPKWKSYIPKVASYVAAIYEKLGENSVVETGSRGQFDVYVDDILAISRKGGLLALVTRKPWPTVEDVIQAILNAKDQDC